MKPRFSNRSLFTTFAAVTLTLAPAVHAAPHYWDNNGAISGAGGASPSGTWSTDSTGASATPAYTTLASDDLLFSAGTTATGAYTISLTDAQNAKSLTFQEGNVTLSGTGGIITLGGAGGNIAVNDGVKNLVEYALVNGGERGVLSGNTITFTKRGAPYGSDVSYAIETSETLANDWMTAVAGVTENSTLISYTFTPSTPVKKFARLKVVQVP